MSEPLSCTEPTAYDRITSDGGKAGVKFRLQLVVVNASGHEHVQEVARIERDEVSIETLGLTLAEGKLILKSIQEGMVQEQIQDGTQAGSVTPWFLVLSTGWVLGINGT